MSKCNVEAYVNCDSLTTSARLPENNTSLHIEFFSVNAPAIAVSAAAPNGDGLDRNGNLPGRVRGQPGAATCFTVISFNPQGMRDAIAIGKIDALATNAGRPWLVAINESWPDKTVGHARLSDITPLRG